MIINTSELSGKALDWAVAQAIGCKVNYCVHAECLLAEPMQWIDGCSFGGETAWMPTKKWSQCGPLIEEFNIDFQTCISDGDNETNESKLAYFIHPESYLVIDIHGETHLIAACRAIVAAFIGDTVEVPDELIGGED